MTEMAEFVIMDDEFEEDSNISNGGNVGGTDYTVTFASPDNDENSGYITPDLNSNGTSNADPNRTVTSDPLGEKTKAKHTSEYAHWSKTAVFAFVETYQTINRNSMNITRRELWKQVSQMMVDQGFKYTPEQCNAKYKTLLRQYRAVKAYNATHSDIREWPYYELMESVVGKNYWGIANSSRTKTQKFYSEYLPRENLEESNTEMMDFTNGSHTSQSDGEDSQPVKNVTKNSATSNTARTGSPGTVKGLLLKLINQKAQHEKARRERHRERMESDDRLYRILETLANK